MASKKKCSQFNENLTYHCLLTTHKQKLKVEVCVKNTWISTGHCPIFNVIVLLISEGLCKEEEKNRCPSEDFWSNTTWKYQACYQNTISMYESMSSVQKDEEPTEIGPAIAAFTIAICLFCLSIYSIFKSCKMLYRRHIMLPSVPLSSASEPVHIILLGQTGAGKSSTGNTILDKQFFSCKLSSGPVTHRRQKTDATVCGMKVCIIDTPGFEQPGFKKVINKTVIKPHFEKQVLILIIRPSRFTAQQAHFFNSLNDYFDSSHYNQTIVLFTERDELECNGMTVPGYISSAPPKLQDLIRKCNNRYIAFNNKASSHAKHEQTKALINIIKRDMMRKQNNDEHYDDCNERNPLLKEEY